MDVHWSREFESNPGTVTIIKDCVGRYFVTLCLDEKVNILPKTGEAVGIDLGINRLATLSNGEHIANPRHLGFKLRKLARLQRILARRKKGSGRWNSQRIKVARCHAHISDSRKDYLDKLTTNLIRRFDVLAIEDLGVRNMMSNGKLARCIGDAGFGMCRRMLEYKADWCGKEVKLVDRFFPSSKRCNCCGFISEKLPLNVREWDCPECKAHHDRDENAAKNILGAGHAPTVRGCQVRRTKVSTSVCNDRRTVNQPALS